MQSASLTPALSAPRTALRLAGRRSSGTLSSAGVSILPQVGRLLLEFVERKTNICWGRGNFSPYEAHDILASEREAQSWPPKGLMSNAISLRLFAFPYHRDTRR